MLGDLD